MDGFPMTADGFLNPMAAAVVAQVISLWLKRYLTDWRWTDLLLLALAVGVELVAGAFTGALTTPAGAMALAWYGVLGASVATFGREVVLDLAAQLLKRGPRTEDALWKLCFDWQHKRRFK